MAQPALLFVYGTLRLGTGMARVDRRFAACARAIGPAWLPGRLYDLGRYPGAVHRVDVDERVIGDLYRLVDTSRCLRFLDDYEDHRPAAPTRGEFMRRALDVYRPPSDQPVHAWVYLYNGSLRFASRIPSGDYARHRRRA